MNDYPRSLVDNSAVQSLAKHLSQMPQLQALGTTEAGEEAWAIAVGLRDIEGSISAIYGRLLPALRAETPGSGAAADALHAIGEEYRHILYHIVNTRSFSHLLGSVRDD